METPWGAVYVAKAEAAIPRCGPMGLWPHLRMAGHGQPPLPAGPSPTCVYVSVLVRVPRLGLGHDFHVVVHGHESRTHAIPGSR